MPNPIQSFHALLCEGEAFLNDLLEELESKGMVVNHLKADHLCYRVATEGEYQDLKNNLLNHARLLTEAHVNGRPICTFELSTPFRTHGHEVRLLELPAPKPGTNYPTGFEHAEFLIDESFRSFSGRFPQVSFEPALSKALNPELAVKLRNKQAKFHHLPLSRVIEIEESKIRHVVFDLDGTLINSHDAILEINRKVFSQFLHREVNLTEAREKFRPGFAALCTAFGIEKENEREQVVAAWSRLADQFHYSTFDGVKELLRTLKQAGLRLHLWTARDERSAKQILLTNELIDSFDSFSFGTSTLAKPQLKSLNVDWKTEPTGSIVMLGDSGHDMEGGRNIHAICVGALWEPAVSEDSLRQAGAELVFKEPAEFANWILS